jgi:glucose dehydrogenase
MKIFAAVFLAGIIAPGAYCQTDWPAYGYDQEGHTNPMTYAWRNGKQYVVIVTSGVNAFALP